MGVAPLLDSNPACGAREINVKLSDKRERSARVIGASSNSGGPLIDLACRVVGVNAQIYSRSGGYQAS